MAYKSWKQILDSEPELKLKLLENVTKAEQNKKITYTYSSDSSKFNLVRPAVCSPISKDDVKILSNQLTIEGLLSELKNFEDSNMIAIDLETKGTEAHNPENYIVGVGLASDSYILYIPIQLDRAVWNSLLLWLSGQPIYPETVVHTKVSRPGSPLSLGYQGELIAHNVYFDSSFLLRDIGWLNWKWCTHGLLRQLANEGFVGQKWGLKWAQTELLGWKETNEGELDAWLINNGLIKGSVSNKMKEEEGIVERWEAYANGTIRPDKSEMWKAPPSILGYYCGVDAASTYLLFTEVLYPAILTLTELAQDKIVDYHTELFITNCRLLVEQQLSGILIDKDRLVIYREELEEKIHEAGQAFIDHPDISAAINKYDNQVLEAKLATEPVKYKKIKDAPKEPNKFKKNGSPSISWLNWEKKYKEWETLKANPEVSKNWLAWEKQVELIKSTVQFNINSSQQKRWLFYDELGFPVILRTEKGDSAVDKKALGGFGEPGAILKTQNDLNKESQYIDACLGKLRDNILHPQFRVPGTLTGRLAGSGGLNVQQVPKSRSYLECWVPRPGKVWVDCYSEDTEVLTRQGWMLFSQLTGKEQLATYAKDLSMEWKEPEAILSREHKGKMIRFGKAKNGLLVTANHKMLINGEERLAKDIERKANYIPATGIELSTSSHSSSEIWKACLLQADGSKRVGYPGRYNLCLRKERKITKATELLGPASFISNRGDSHWSYQEYTSELLDWETKTLKLNNLGSDKVEEVIAALSFWDGRETDNGWRYSTTVKENIDQLQAYFARSGYITSVGCYIREQYSDCYYLDIRKAEEKRVVGLTEVEYLGKVYCANVGNQYLCVRRGDAVYVSGNCDVASLEQVVMAELSEDPTLWLLYGPGAKANDVYLFNGAALPIIGEKIKAAGYDPLNPTPEGIANAKSEAKKARSMAKVITLGSSYGMGPKKLRETLALQGVPVSQEEAYMMWSGYWELYKGVKEYEKILLEEWKLRGGWVFNGFGRPICVDKDYLKDIVNRVCQSTGHDILMLINYHIQRLIQDAGIEVNGIIWDFHDETLLECAEKDLDPLSDIFKEAYRVTNEELAGAIPLKGDIQICRSLADAKFD